MKHISMTLGVLCLLATSAWGQVKSKFKDKDYDNRTVIIKESSEDDDIKILNSQFNIDDVEVGEEVRITVAREHVEAQGMLKSKPLAAKKHNSLLPKRIKKLPKKLQGTAISYKKKRKKAKPTFVYSTGSKKSRRKGLNEKCYKF